MISLSSAIICLITLSTAVQPDVANAFTIVSPLAQPFTYSPVTCTPTEYKFTFLYDSAQGRMLVHGIWPEECAECTECTYPTCCSPDADSYTVPKDETNFIAMNWYNSTAKEECNEENAGKKVSLFEHEYHKHVRCSQIGTSDDFLELTMDLYDEYYVQMVEGHCSGYKELWMNLDENFGYISTECH